MDSHSFAFSVGIIDQCASMWTSLGKSILCCKMILPGIKFCSAVSARCWWLEYVGSNSVEIPIRQSGNDSIIVHAILHVIVNLEAFRHVLEIGMSKVDGTSVRNICVRWVWLGMISYREAPFQKLRVRCPLRCVLPITNASHTEIVPAAPLSVVEVAYEIMCDARPEQCQTSQFIVEGMGWLRKVWMFCVPNHATSAATSHMRGGHFARYSFDDSALCTACWTWKIICFRNGILIVFNLDVAILDIFLGSAIIKSTSERARSIGFST